MLNYLIRDRSICNVRSIQSGSRCARHFERNADCQYRVVIEFMVVQKLFDRHDVLPEDRREHDRSLSHRRLAQVRYQ